MKAVNEAIKLKENISEYFFLRAKCLAQLAHKDTECLQDVKRVASLEADPIMFITKKISKYKSKQQIEANAKEKKILEILMELLERVNYIKDQSLF